MSDQYLGEIRIFPFNFAPMGWAMCNGQLLAVSQFSALFSLLGVNYGGNGTFNFGLPNLQGSVPINVGTGNGLSTYEIGEAGGSTTVTLLEGEMGVHNHPLTADREVATTADPTGAIYMKGHYDDGAGNKGGLDAYTTLTPDTNMASSAIGFVGGNQPHNNMMPYLALNYCIALSGEFPPRS